MTYYYSMYLLSIIHFLRNSYFLQSKLHSIESLTLNLILIKYYIDNKTHIKITFHSVLLGGMDFQNLLAEHYILQLQQFIRHSRCKNDNNKLIMISLQWDQYCCGTEKSILTDGKTDIAYA